MTKSPIVALMFSSVFMIVAALPTSALAVDKMQDVTPHLSQKMLRGLDLTDTQKQQIEQLMATHRANKPDRSTAQPLRAELKTLLDQPTFDEAGVRMLLEKHQQQRLEYQVQQIKLQHQIRQLLTPEQKAKLEERKQKMLRKAQRQA